MTGPPLPTYPHHSHEQCGIQIDLRHTNVWTLKKGRDNPSHEGNNNLFSRIIKKSLEVY